VYLDNSSSPDIRNRLIGAVQDVRQDLPVQVIEASTDVSQAVRPQLEFHSELVVEVGKATLRITGTPDPQTLQLVLQQLLR
jgi:transposase